jgi:putative lipoprotein
MDPPSSDNRNIMNKTARIAATAFITAAPVSGSWNGHGTPHTRCPQWCPLAAGNTLDAVRMLSVLLTVMLASCAGTPDARVIVRGQVVNGHEVRTLTECGSAQPTWLIDETNGELRRWYDRLSTEPYQSLFFELSGYREDAPDSGFGADYPAAIRATVVLRAEREGFGCEEDLSAFRFKAFGNEPSWQLVASPSELRFDSPVGPSLSVPAPVEFVDDASIRLEGSRGSDTILVAVEPGHCTDSMSGSLYAFRARVAVNGEIYSGCAIAGNEAPD